MKAIRYSLIPIGLTALLAAPAIAIEPPADNSPPPAVPQAADQAPDQAPAAARPEAAAPGYLGLGTSPVPEALAAHLGLKPEEGVVIHLLDPNGPALKAGLAEHDVIIRVNGQAVGSQDDLSAEVRKHQPGAEVAIDYIHQAKPEKKSIVLGVRPAGADLPGPNPLENLMQGMPQDQAKRLREAVERQLRAFEDDGAMPQLGQGMDDIRKLQQEMQKRMAEGLKQAQGNGGFKMMGGATVRVHDQEGAVEIRSKDGSKEASVLDKDGKTTWSGPWDTEQDKAAAPPEVRARIEKLKLDENFMGGGLRLRLGPQPLEPDDEEAEAPAKPGPDAAQPAPEAPKAGDIK